MLPIKITLQSGAKMPEYQTQGAAGADLFAHLTKSITIRSGEILLIPTGIVLEIPDGYEAQIRPRSGLAINHGLTLLNSPGTIDADYRGEIKIILINLGRDEFTIINGMRIAQIIFSRVYRGNFTEVNELTFTERNNGGFGHSGV